MNNKLLTGFSDFLGIYLLHIVIRPETQSAIDFQFIALTKL